MPEPTPAEWAAAVALRLSSEWSPVNNDPELEATIHHVLFEALKDRPELTEQLVGTAVVEDSYFEEIDG